LILEEFSKRTNSDLDGWYEAKIQQLAEFFTSQLEPDPHLQQEILAQTVDSPATVILAQREPVEVGA